MRNMGIAITTIVASLLLAGTALADTINVPGDHTLIQDAINASSDGDVINIAAGTYNEHSLNPGGKAITIQGTLNGDGSLATTIDAQQGGSVFVVQSGEDSGTIIQDLVITGGLDNYGGGIYCSSSSPTITGCEISNNTATTDDGGGIYCNNSNATITGCTISGNTAIYGGGIYCWNYSSPIITNCTITGNTANSNGGGIYHSASSSHSILTDTTVCGNTPNQIYGTWNDEGGNTLAAVCSVPGACCTNGQCMITEEDDCLDFYGQWLGEGSSCDDCPPPVEPEVLGACCINGGCVPSTVEGCFAGGGSYAGDDVTCADAGCPEVCPGDLTGDNQVTIMDLLFVLDAWGATCP